MARPPTVGDLMSPNPIVIAADAPMVEAARLMDRHRISGLAVVDERGRLVGVVSQTDLLRARATEHLWRGWPGLAVRHLMTSPAVTVHRSTTVDAAVRLMESRGIHRVVVVDDADEGIPLGILSVSDIVRAMAQEEPDVGR